MRRLLMSVVVLVATVLQLVAVDAGAASAADERFVSDLQWVSSVNGWGPVERDRSNGEQGASDGRVLTLQGQTFAKGLGVHAASEVGFVVPAGCTTFSAVVGVDDEVGAGGLVVFEVFDGANRVYTSGPRTGSSANAVVSVPVTAGGTVRLVVTDGGNGIGQDHADWADAKLTCGTTAPRRFATDLAAPWDIVAVPEGGALVSERATARIKWVKPDGSVVVLGQVAGVVANTGESGLLGLALSPSFATDRLVYAYISTAGDNRIVRMTVPPSGGLGAPQDVFTGIPRSNGHHGGRIAFGPDGHLHIGTGDTFVPDTAQDLQSLAGKVLRITTDGRPAPGNPWPGSPVYTLGHRNVQGLAFDGAGRLFASELGADLFDEINRIEAGKNYGWPVVEGRSDDPRFVDPLVTWAPAEASPSGMTFAAGSLWVASLRGERLWQVPVDALGRTGTPRIALQGEGRLRDVEVVGGELWVLTNATGTLTAGVVRVPLP